MSLAADYVRSGLFPVLDAPSAEIAEARASALIAAAIEADIPPSVYLASAYRYEDGTLGTSAHLVAARIERSGVYRYRPVIRHALRVMIEFLRRDDGAPANWAVRCGGVCGLLETRDGDVARPELCRGCRAFAIVTEIQAGWQWAGDADWPLDRAQKAGALDSRDEPGAYDPTKDPMPTLWRRAMLEGARHHCPGLFAWAPAGAAGPSSTATSSPGTSFPLPRWKAAPDYSMPIESVRGEVLARVTEHELVGHPIGLPASDRVEPKPGADVIRFAWPDGKRLAWAYSLRATAHPANADKGGAARWIACDFPVVAADAAGMDPEEQAGRLGVCVLHGDPRLKCACPLMSAVLGPTLRMPPDKKQADAGSAGSSPPAKATPPAGAVPAGAPSTGTTTAAEPPSSPRLDSGGDASSLPAAGAVPAAGSSTAPPPSTTIPDPEVPGGGGGATPPDGAVSSGASSHDEVAQTGTPSGVHAPLETPGHEHRLPKPEDAGPSARPSSPSHADAPQRGASPEETSEGRTLATEQPPGSLGRAHAPATGEQLAVVGKVAESVQAKAETPKERRERIKDGLVPLPLTAIVDRDLKPANVIAPPSDTEETLGRKARAGQWLKCKAHEAREPRGPCALCGEEIDGGDRYREGLAPPPKGQIVRRRSAKPTGRAHTSCVQELAAGRDPRASMPPLLRDPSDEGDEDETPDIPEGHAHA